MLRHIVKVLCDTILFMSPLVSIIDVKTIVLFRIDRWEHINLVQKTKCSNTTVILNALQRHLAATARTV